MAVILASSGSVSDVQAALTAAQDGDTVAIPAGSWTWTSGISLTLTKSLTLRGAGAIAATTGGAATTGSDLTTILDHHPTVGHSLLNFSVASGKLLRLTDLAITQDGTSTTTQTGVVHVSGGPNSLRIDHCHFVINPDSSMTIQVNSNSSTALTGVIDHNYFDSAVGNGPFGVYLQHGVGTGDAAWAAADGFGTANFLFIEDNRWRNGYLGDANTGGQRFVYRYNTAVIQANDSVPTVGYVANHGLTSARGRSTRAFEYYGNNMSALAPGLNKSPFPVNGGTGLVWGNTISQYRYCTALDYTRKSNATYPYGTPPTGWGNCTGTVGTVWDGPGGYPGLDQPGRGMGNLLSGSTVATTVNTRTGTQAEAQQASSPIYVWGNTFSPAGYSPTPVVANAASPLLTANRDYYSSEGAVAGVTGVVSGLRSARPSTATTGVGYWATDEQTLYVASAPNTWSLYYTPYTYPHPLVAPTQPAVLTADRLVFESSIYLGTTPSSGGDPKFGRGMAFRTEGGILKLMIGSYNPQVILEYSVPANRSGAATYVRNLGTLPNVSSRFGLFWDETESKLYSIQGLLYGNVATAKTFSRGSIVNGVLVSDGEWALSGVSYKAVQGGMTAVPSWFQTAYGVGRLASGFGGYYSVLATGPVSMGPALASFTPPTAAGQTVTATPLQQYPFTSSSLSVPRQQRPTNYKQYYENTNTTTGAPLNNPSLVPVDPTVSGIGYWHWADEIYGGGAWVDTPNFSGMVYLAAMGTSCCWYGNNFGYVNECSHSLGSPAAINSTSRLHYWLVTNPTDLGAVAQGASPTSIQSTLTAVQFPSLPITIASNESAYPFIGKPSERLTPAGMTWIPSIQRLAVGLYQSTGGAASTSSLRIYFYKVSEGGDPPTPTPPANDPFANAVTISGASGTVNGSTVNSTIQSGEPPAMGSVWYTYATTGNAVDFSLSATGQTAQAYIGTSVGGLTLVTSGTTFILPAGSQTYRIRVIPEVTTNGFALSWDDEEPPPPPPPPPPDPDPLAITNASLPLGEQTVPYSVTYSATGGVQPATWTQSGAPTGVTMSTSGVLSGIPAANGTFTVAATVTDSQPVSTQKSLSLTIIPPPVVSTLALTSGQVDTVYPGAQLAVAGGTAPYTWTQTGGPTGLTLSTTGAYTGTPTQSGSFTVAAVVTDARGATASRNLSLLIAAAPDALVVTTSSLPAGQISVVYTGATMAATGGVAPYTWSQTGGPTGLSMSSGGAYTGTPSQSGSFTVAVTVTDSALTATVRNLLLGILAEPPPPTPDPIPPLVLTTESLPQGTVGVPYTAQLTATGGTVPRTFAAQDLPTNFTLLSSGLLTGTPTVAVDVVIQFSVTDASNPPLTTGVGLSLVVVGGPTDPNVDPPTEVPAPVAPPLYVPRNKSKNVRNVTTGGSVVRWFAVQGADTYQIFHGITANPPLVGTIQAGDATYAADYPANSLFFPVTRVASTTYFWSVLALNAGGQTISALWRYTTARPAR